MTLKGTAASQRPTASSERVRRQMSKQLTRDTAPEIAIRRALHAMGLRYRVNALVVPGLRRRGDIVFSRRKVAVFVDGCFWHRCPIHATDPKANAEWWAEKLDRNVTRDRETDAQLASEGWRVIRVWEHEDPLASAERIACLVKGIATSTPAGH